MTFVQGSALGGPGMVKRFATGSYPQQLRVQNLSMPMPKVPPTATTRSTTTSMQTLQQSQLGTMQSGFFRMLLMWTTESHRQVLHNKDSSALAW